jgi:hypothetical protein
MIALLLYTACDKPDVEVDAPCRTALLGNYKETIPNPNTTTVLEISEATTEREVVLLFQNKNQNTGTQESFAVTGKLNEDCTILSIPEQEYGDVNYRIAGDLTVNKERIFGALTTNVIFTPSIKVDCTKE